MTIPVTFSEFARLSPDVSADYSILAFAVDWSRGWAYTVSNDGTIRVYDIATVTCLRSAAWATVFGAIAPPGAATMLACIPGGALYASAPGLILTVDPTSLTLTHTAAAPNPPFDYFILAVAYAVGTSVLMIGKFQQADTCVVNVTTGQSSSLPLAYGGFFGARSPSISIGQPGVAWFLDTDSVGDGCAIYRLTSPADPTNVIANGQWQLMATLHAADFGAVSQPFNVTSVYVPADDTLILSSDELGASVKWNCSAHTVVWVTATRLISGWSHAYFDASAGSFCDGNNSVDTTFWSVDVTSGTRTEAVPANVNLAGTVLGYSSNKLVYQGALDGRLWLATFIPPPPYVVRPVYIGTGQVFSAVGQTFSNRS